jgi:hypothetical protein
MRSDPGPTTPWWVLPSGRIRPVWWLAVVPVLIGFDYAAGPDTPMPSLYVLPVCVAAWYSGQRAAVALAVAVPLAHLVFVLALWPQPAGVWRIVWTVVLRATVVAFIALVFARQSDHERQLRRDLEQRHALELRAEQLRVVQVTMRTVQDIVNNCLNQLLLLRLDAEAYVPAESIESFDRAIKDASSRLNALADLEAYAEKQMEIGTGLDAGEAGLSRA